MRVARGCDALPANPGGLYSVQVSPRPSSSRRDLTLRRASVALLASIVVPGCQPSDDRASVGRTSIGEHVGIGAANHGEGSEIAAWRDSASVVVAAAGDIASCTNQHDSATAALLDSIPGIVLTLGDNAYPEGTYDEFVRCYSPTWGRHRARTRPTAGNHEYRQSRGGGYFRYFGEAAGTPEQSYYSFDVGAWHIISVNTNIDVGPRSRQLSWLRSDLQSSHARARRCALAFMHHPIRSSGKNGNNPWLRPLWEVLHEHGVDLVLAGHDHGYERFAPLTLGGELDAVRGIPLFVVGTGGASLRPFNAPRPHSEFRQAQSFGVLKLTLGPSGYRWEFVAADRRGMLDAGEASCY